MKKRNLFYTVIALILTSLTLLGGCTADIPKDTDTTAIHDTETDVNDVNDTTDTAAVETEPGEPVFNQGKVVYTKNEKVTVIEPFDTSLLGSTVKSGQAGTVMLFDENFNDGDPNCSGNASSREEGRTGVKDGILYVPYDAKLDPPLGKGWTTWAPNVNASVSDYVQVQLSTDTTLYPASNAPWMTGMIGCFVSNYTYKIPDNPGDGIWLSLNSISGNIVIYGGTSANWSWPTGNAMVAVPDKLLNGNTHIDVVCTQERSIFVYVKNVLCCKITCENGVMTVFDSTGEQTYSGELDMNSISNGSHFSIFTHGESCMGFDNMQIIACSKGETKVETNVSATPTGDNKLGLDITDRSDVVSICYSMWFNAINGDGTSKIENAPNVSEMLAKYKFTTAYGFGKRGDQHNLETAFHYWAKPAQGYYRSTDTDAIRNNMTMLYNAGVDFIILDYTYAVYNGYQPGSSNWSLYIHKPSVALLDTIMQMRAEGLGTPYVVFWVQNESMFDTLYEQFYGVEKWKDCFVYWNGLPFILEWTYSKSSDEHYTIRGMYGLQGRAADGQWSYLEINNSSTVSYNGEGNPEHMCACVATQETYMSLPSAHGRDGGKFWNGQWKNVFEVHPKIVTVTWWNEWCAQLYNVSGVGYVFTDNFNQEYSRDIEPMEGGHGDLYYRWLCQYIKDYRSGSQCPELTEE